MLICQKTEGVWGLPHEKPICVYKWVRQQFLKTKKKQELFPNFPYLLDDTPAI